MDPNMVLDRGGLVVSPWKTTLCGLTVALAASSNIAILIWDIHNRFVVELALPLVTFVCFFFNRGLLTELLQTVASKVWLCALTLITICAFIGFGRHHDLINAYADWRANLTLITSILYFGRRWRRDSDRITFLVSTLIFSGLLDLVAARWRINTMDYAVDRSAYNVMGMYALLTIGVQLERFWTVIASLSIMTAMALTGFFRQYYIVLGYSAAVLLAVSIMFILLPKWKKRNQWFGSQLLVLLVIGAACGLYEQQQIFDFLTGTQVHAIHSVQRTQELLDSIQVGDLSSESARLNSIKILFANFTDLLLPHGLGWRAEMEDVESAYGLKYAIISTMDSSYFYVAYHYSIFVLFALLGVALLVAKGAIASKYDPIVKLLAVAGIGLVLIVFSLEAGMFTIIPRAISYGIAIGVLVSPLRPPVLFSKNESAVVSRNHSRHFRRA